MRGLLWQLAHPLAVAEHDAAPRHVDLPARTGAGQVAVGAGGAARLAALGRSALLAVTAPANRCTEGNVKAGPAI